MRRNKKLLEKEVIRKESKMAVQSDYGTSSFEPDLYNRLEKENIKNRKKKLPILFSYFSPISSVLETYFL